MKTKITLEQFLDERGQLHNFLCEACWRGVDPDMALKLGIAGAFLWVDTRSDWYFWSLLMEEWLCEKQNKT